jgi:hypothetical protein
MVMEELEAENKWERVFAASEDVLDKLADEAIAAHNRGKTKPLNIKDGLLHKCCIRRNTVSLTHPQTVPGAKKAV